MSKLSSVHSLGMSIVMACMCPAVSAQSRAASPTASTAASVQSADASAKAKILASPEWKQLDATFQKWLAAQAIYTPADIKRINASLAAQLRAVPASEIQGFLDDWQARLNVLKGADFQEAQNWLGQYLSAFNAGFRRQRLQDLGLTDVANMSASQLENAIVRVHSHRLSRQQSQAAFDQTRARRVQTGQQSNVAARQAPAGRGAARFGTNQSPYRPPKFNPPPPPRQQFFVDGDGRIGFALPL